MVQYGIDCMGSVKKLIKTTSAGKQNPFQKTLLCNGIPLEEYWKPHPEIAWDKIKLYLGDLLGEVFPIASW